jgi:hypothetical protein
MKKLIELYVEHLNKASKAYDIWLRLAYDETTRQETIDEAWRKFEKESRMKHLVLKLVRYKYGDKLVSDFMHVAYIIAGEC